MKLQGFLKLIDMHRRLSSFIPLLTGTVFCLYRYGDFKCENFLLMLLFSLSFDMAACALKNHSDFKYTGFFFFIIAAASGTGLILNTSTLVLIIIAIIFIAAWLYSWGPVPIKKTPFGEIHAGFFMGFLPVFLSIYIHLDINSFLKLSFDGIYYALRFDIYEILLVILVSIPCILCITNIHLANNLCEMVEKKPNNIHTLPQYIGKEQSLRLFSALYFISYASIVLSVILRAVPLVSMLTLLTVFPLTVNLKLFYFKQTKKHTFSLSIKNFMLICVSYLATIMLGLFI